MSRSRLLDLPRRAADAVTDLGVRGAAVMVLRRVRQEVFLDVRHLWYELSLTADRPRRPLPEGVRLVPAGEEDLPRLVALGPWAARVLARYREEGGTAWMVLEGDVLLFSCWIFSRRMPTIAARGRWLDAASGAVFLEDSVTAPKARGRGIAPAAWSTLADHLQRTGLAHVYTPVDEANRAVQAALAKAGFVPVARVRMVRRGPSRSVRVEPLADSGRWLRDALQR